MLTGVMTGGGTVGGDTGSPAISATGIGRGNGTARKCDGDVIDDDDDDDDGEEEGDEEVVQASHPMDVTHAATLADVITMRSPTAPTLPPFIAFLMEAALLSTTSIRSIAAC